MFDVFLIAKATDGQAEALREVVAVHSGGIVVQDAVVRVAATGLGSTPKVGIVAEKVVAAEVAASR